ncbi:MAG: hypothetical protein MN733_11190 [Nitrososphaera sp.]|nr:hypothetical protein [Nitrososphaera sp.]
MSYNLHTCEPLRISNDFLDFGARGIAQASHEKSKKETSSIDDKTIENMVRYYKVEEKNFDSLLKYIKNRGLPADAN